MKQQSFFETIESRIKLDRMMMSLMKEVNESINIIYKKLKKGGKIFICGNGGSAADAQHLSVEFLVRLRPKVNRKPFAAISLAQDVSTITACGNDYNYHDLFSRNLEALGVKNDLLIVISTSGNSKNIIKVLKKARSNKIKSIALLGMKGGKAKGISDLDIILSESNVARIQEAQIFLGHYIFEKAEDLLIR
jgi:D-sedoheptulose 7-phosphate isomerase